MPVYGARRPERIARTAASWTGRIVAVCAVLISLIASAALAAALIVYLLSLAALSV